MIYRIDRKTKKHHVHLGLRDGNDGRWDYVEATPDGWIEHDGRGCPLPESHLCDIRSRNGVMRFNIPAGVHLGGPIPDAGPAFWDYYGIGEDIIAYRPILDADTKPEPPAWDGKGRPPIGEVVMVRSGECKSPGKVLALDHNIVVVRYEAGLGFKYSGFDLDDISPIRSEEDRAVEDMVDAIMGHHKDDGVNTDDLGLQLQAMDHARALYRAGYRKTAAADGEEG